MYFTQEIKTEESESDFIQGYGRVYRYMHVVRNELHGCTTGSRQTHVEFEILESMIETVSIDDDLKSKRRWFMKTAGRWL